MAFTEKQASEHIRDIHKRLTGKDMEPFNVPSWMIEGLVSGRLEMYTCEPYTPRDTAASTRPGDFYAS